MLAKLSRTYNAFYKNMGFGVWLIIFLCWFSSENNIGNLSRLLFLLSCLGYIGRKSIITGAAAISVIASVVGFSAYSGWNIALLTTEALFLYDMFVLYFHPEYKVQIKQNDIGYIVLIVYTLLFCLVAVSFWRSFL